MYFNVFAIPIRDTRAANQRKFNTEKCENAKYKNSSYYKASALWDTFTDNVVDGDTIRVL